MVAVTDSRPLGLTELHDLPIGARVVDREGHEWVREPHPDHPDRPDWFRYAAHSGCSVIEPFHSLHFYHGPLRLVP